MRRLARITSRSVAVAKVTATPLAVQGLPKGLRAGFGLHLVPVKGENTFIDAIGNGLAGLGATHRSA